MNEQIEAIRAEIERRKKENMYDELPMTIGRYYEDRDLLAFIDSLPEEPAPKGYDEAYLNECIAKASKTWEGVDVDKYMDEVRGNRPKLSDNLEEAASEYISAYYAIHHREPDMTSLFVAGAQWQKDRINIDISKQVAAAYQLGEKGKEEQMLKDAVDAIVENWNPDPEPEITIPLNPEEFTPGDKVRIIIVKEDKE